MATDVQAPPRATPDPEGRRPGELTLRELVRYGWRQLTSMRTALILLLLLALAAVPGSVIPQQGVDALKTSQWQTNHPTLAPIYQRLGLFDVYGSPWFSAIYLLLMVSLVGCIVPRTAHYWRGMRAQPPAAPRNLSRLPDHTSYRTTTSPADVIAAAAVELRRQRYRVVETPDAVSAERGYLREAGNLLFHLSVVVVLVGFAVGALFGYKGGVIVVQGTSFTNTSTQYDDLEPGSLFREDQLDPFNLTVDDFHVQWLDSGPRAGMAREFRSEVSYADEPGGPEKTYDLRVNHPLTIGSTEVFLIGHGYAPEITVRDADGNIVASGPVVFLPEDASFRSFGVVKAQNAKPTQIGLQGELYPTYGVDQNGDPLSVFGKALDPVLALFVWTGDLNMGSGASQSVYSLDTSKAVQEQNADGSPLRLDLREGDTVDLPGGIGTVTFDGMTAWNKIQISQSPGKRVALVGVVMALVGLLMSLFLRPRRVFVRARAAGPDDPDDPDDTAPGTLVEVAALDRSGGADVGVVVEELAAVLEADLGRAGGRSSRTGKKSNDEGDPS